jgi:filamentous hemagglutinin
LISATGTITSAADITGNNLLTGGTTSATGNITGGNLLTAGLISATSTITSAANITGGNVLTSGLISATGNITSGNVLTGGLISATGNITGDNLNAAGLSLSGNVLSVINSTSNITTTANAAIGNLLTDGLYHANGVAWDFQQPAGSNTQIQYNDGSGGFGASANFTFNDSTQLLSVAGAQSVTGNISGANVISGTTLSATANVIGGNITTAGLISATSTITSAANIAGGNITTGGEVSATGNITGGNLNTTGQLSTSGNLAANNVSVTNSLTSSVISASANITGGNLLTSGLISSAGTITGTTITGSTLSSTGNVNTVGIVGTGNISTTGNISGGNILTGGLSLSANVISEINTTSNITTTANISSGNVLTARVSASGNIDGANINVGTAVYTSNIIGKTNALTLESVSNGNINLFPNGTGNIVLANTTINGLAEPLQSQDAATKFYVDNAVTTGFAFHQPVFAATNTDLATATGGTITYAQPNGAANGIGATITTTGSFNLIDTANVQTANTRILVKNEANAVLNGVYVWSNATVITRSVDADQYGSDSAESFSINDYFFTQSGNVNAGTAFIVNAPAGIITFGTSNITFAEFSSTQVYSANTSAGISLTGTVFSAKVDNTTTAFDGGGNIVVKASAQLTTPNIGAATGDSLSVTGLITAGNITAGTGYISTTGNVIGGNITTGGLITATGNIVSSANVSGGNILTGGLISAVATITGGNLATGGTASATGNITGGNVLTSGLISATGNITGGNILTVGIVSTSGNVYGNAILSDYYYYANGTPVPPGIIYTANTAPPTSPAPKVTDQWYDTASDVLYEYINDGTSTYWVDTTSPAFAGGVVANVAISGTLVPVANVTYDIGTNTVYFRNTYTQNLYTNNRLTASNMPSGAVVQTIMSTSLGGSATTGTSYSDIALANVVIQPSSANSKVLIIATGTSSFTPLAAANLTASTQLVRTAASLQVQEYSANIAGGGVGGSSAVAFSYLDSPNTTSPVTYKMQQKISNSSSTLTSSNMWIIAMEIAVP